MLRNPLQSAASRGSRPDLHRVADGIASSLRQFSIAQARCDDEPQRPTTGRQRSAAAVKELFSMSQQDKQPNSRGGGSSSNNANATPKFTPRAPEAPKVISVSSLRGGTRGRFAGPRPGYSTPPPAAAGFAPGTGPFTGGKVIRGGLPGGFRGRGGGARGGARGGFDARGRGGRGGFSRGRGGAMASGGRGRGSRGRGKGSDDRPNRPNELWSNLAAEAAYQRFASRGAGENTEYETWTSPKDDGTVKAYNPAFDLIQDLAGYAPAIASSTTPLAQHATALKQARMLGGGRRYSADDIPWPDDAKKQYTEGHGIFFPTEEAKKLVSRTAGMEFKAPPAETKSAILDAALLGKYDGPKFAQPGDHRGSVQSFVRREGTWTAAAERRIDAKISSLLPSQQTAAAAARPAPKAKA